jgi:hypothetical protein
MHSRKRTRALANRFPARIVVAAIVEASSRSAHLGPGNVGETVADGIEDNVRVRETAPVVLTVAQPVLMEIDPPRPDCVLRLHVTAVDECRRTAVPIGKQRTPTLYRLRFVEHRAVDIAIARAESRAFPIHFDRTGDRSRASKDQSQCDETGTGAPRR